MVKKNSGDFGEILYNFSKAKILSSSTLLYTVVTGVSHRDFMFEDRSENGFYAFLPQNIREVMHMLMDLI